MWFKFIGGLKLFKLVSFYFLSSCIHLKQKEIKILVWNINKILIYCNIFKWSLLIMNRTSSIHGLSNLLIKDIYTSNLTADNRGALRELEGLEKLVDFVGNKVQFNLHVN